MNRLYAPGYRQPAYPSGREPDRHRPESLPDRFYQQPLVARGRTDEPRNGTDDRQRGTPPEGISQEKRRSAPATGKRTPAADRLRGARQEAPRPCGVRRRPTVAERIGRAGKEQAGQGLRPALRIRGADVQGVGDRPGVRAEVFVQPVRNPP